MNLPRTKHARIQAVRSATRSHHALRARTAIAREILTSVPLFVVDAATLVGAVALASALSPADGDGAMMRAVPAIALFTFFMRGLYPGVALHPVDELRRLAMGVTVGFGAYATCVFALAPGAGSLLAIAAGWLVALAAVPCLRWTARHVLARTSWWGCETLLLGRPPKGSRDQLRRQGLLPVATPIDIARPESRLNLDYVDSAWLVSFGSEAPGKLASRGPSAGRLGLVDATVAQVRPPVRKLRYRIAKRSLDLAVALALVPFLAPVAAVVALSIRLTSRGPIFYSHRRLGRGGRTFSVWKFRTMAVDADKKLSEYLESNPELAKEWRENQKLLRDPRVTPVGRLLRKTSLDEIPQLWNVLSGDMSLVGPRPIVEDEIPRYGATYNAYKEVLPGVTGLWQVSGRNNTSYPERVRLDGEYVRDWSLGMDMYILMRTARTVVLTEGAS